MMGFYAEYISGKLKRNRRDMLSKKRKKPTAWWALAIIVVMAALIVVAAKHQPPKTASAGLDLIGRSIVIDAGHGGFDGGAKGYAGTIEADVNLAVAKGLESKLKSLGARVVMTRSDENAIADGKKADMQKRRDIIENSRADIVLSIHQNAHPNVNNYGPVVYYHGESERGKALAVAIQQALNAGLKPEKERIASVGDYFILKSGEMPCVIVECGFITNPTEEGKLNDPVYQEKIWEGVAVGVLAYFKAQ
jgi:N-acetylmuramoyl-L-alanine amidase